MKKIYIYISIILIFLVGILFLLIKNKPLKIGATYMNMNNPYFITLNNSIKQIVDLNGDILITRDPSQSQERQNIIISEMVDEGIDFLLVQPVDLKEIGPSIKKCREHNIPVIVVDSKIQDDDMVLFNVLSDNYSAGRQIALDIINTNKEARIVIIHDKNISSTRDRIRGVTDILNNLNNFPIVRLYDNVEGLEDTMCAVEQLIKDKVEVDVIVASNDPTAIGALAAIRKSGMGKKIIIYGVDGSPDVKMMIQKGYIRGTSAQSPSKIGKLAAESLYKYINNEKIEKEILVDVHLITQDNINQFDISGWE